MIRFVEKDVYLACGKTDMRKSINGLSAIVEGSFKLDPFSGALFVFCNRNRDRLKILEWDGDGFWLYCISWKMKASLSERSEPGWRSRMSQCLAKR